MPGCEITVRGRVQGVGYRWFVLDCAIRHGIRGYVKNMPDGTVLIIATGNTDSLDRFIPEIKQGNRHAVVSDMTVSELTHHSDYEDFVIA
jgi:acylphosphatase